jgi:hypothetical protein
MTNFIHLGVTLSRPQVERIQALATRQGVSRAVVIRNLVDTALPFAEHGHGIDYIRLLSIFEYSILALDTLVKKLSPEQADHIIDLATSRVRQHHGA